MARMTNNEAIEELKFWRDEMLITERAKEAFDIGIKAIENLERIGFTEDSGKQICIDDLMY